MSCSTLPLPPISSSRRAFSSGVSAQQDAQCVDAVEQFGLAVLPGSKCGAHRASTPSGSDDPGGIASSSWLNSDSMSSCVDSHHGGRVVWLSTAQISTMQANQAMAASTITAVAPAPICRTLVTHDPCPEDAVELGKPGDFTRGQYPNVTSATRTRSEQFAQQLLLEGGVRRVGDARVGLGAGAAGSAWRARTRGSRPRRGTTPMPLAPTPPKGRSGTETCSSVWLTVTPPADRALDDAVDRRPLVSRRRRARAAWADR